MAEPIVTQEAIEAGLQFLLEKGVYAANEIIRTAQFNLVRNPSLLNDIKERKKYEQIQQRLINLFSAKCEVHSNNIPAEDIHQFKSTEFPGFDNVFFQVHPKALCQRHQKSGLCYMHGPATIQHYTLVHNEHDAPMIDLLKFVQTQFTSRQLESHLFADEGGDSHKFLKSILEPNSVLASVFSLDDTIEELFGKYGPGLVSQFKVYECFYDNNVHHHKGKPRGNFIGLHAMALVGCRKDKDRRFFLLQNWWKKKQFAEVDEEYLRCCDAQFHFVKTHQTSIPESFASNYGTYYELEAVDKEEGHSFEM